MDATETLSDRGRELAKNNIRDKFSAMFSDVYDAGTNPNGFVNLGVSENYIMTEEVAEFATRKHEAAAKTFTYGEGPWGSERLRKAMANHMNKHFKPFEPVDANDIIFANGVTALCEMLGFSIAEPGDGILMSRPIYQAFQSDFGTKAHVRCVFTSFGDVDQFSPAAVSKYEEALVAAESSGTRVRALLLCHPHNPLGQCYPESTIVGLMKLCQKYKIHLLVDEIYAASVYEIPDKNALPFTSSLAFDSSPYIDANLLHLLYGLAKDFACGGLRLGCFWTRNSALRAAMSSIGQFHWSGASNETVATHMLEDQAWLEEFLATSRSRLAHNNKLTRQLLDEQGIEYHTGANAGFFIWVDLRPYLAKTGASDGWAAEKKLLESMLARKVYINDGESLSAEEPGWFRIVFSQEERTLREGLRRVFEAIRSGE
ncbi:hypothetical protein H2203_001440 [Taxawa tesnikishii (nom. ined.)]|nr:hypothetical protein H2203_001440 [Dothideales sp. JES 119]